MVWAYSSLEGDITEVSDKIIAANLQEIENIKEEPEEVEWSASPMSLDLIVGLWTIF